MNQKFAEMFERLYPEEALLLRLREVAIECGITDNSYSTVAFGTVFSYSGTVEFEYAGIRYQAIGHKPEGTPWCVTRMGYIEIIAL